MRNRKVKQRLLAAALVVLAAVCLAVPASAYDIYHGVGANQQGAVDWTKDSFAVSGGEAPNLSFFHFDSDNAARQDPQMRDFACMVKVTVAGNPAQADTRQLGQPPAAVIPTFRPLLPWSMVFDNHPLGHWNISKIAIMNVSNNTAGTVAAGAFKGLATAQNSGVTVINGTNNHCHV